MSIHDYEPIITVATSPFADGPLALYQSPYDDRRLHLDLGDDIVTTSTTDLVPLAKAILNAVEPDALAEDQRVTDEPTPTRRVASPKFPVGTRVEIVDDGVRGHRNGWTGRTGTVVEPDDTTDLFYDIRVEVDGPLGGWVQFYNTEVVEAPSHKHVEGLYRANGSTVWVTHESEPGYYTLRYLTEDDGRKVNKGMTDAVLNNYTLVSAA